MSRREWKPGDVALVEAGCHANRVVAVRTGVPSNMGWAYSGTHNGESTQCWSSDGSGVVTPIRPLVVIDPEDREQVERLCLDWFDGDDPGEASVTQMQDSLRSLVTPPKPDEPTGLGAVVEDAEGRRWTRPTLPAGANAQWVEAISAAVRHYAAIDAVRVLSEGVQP